MDWLKWFRKKKKPRTREEIMEEALADLKSDQERKKKRRARGGRLSLRGWFDKRIIAGIAIIAIVFIADGIRRENQEFYAHVINVTGQAYASTQGSSAPEALKVGDYLEDDSFITTGFNSQVVLDFPDQSTMVVGPRTQMQIQHLEYHRGGAWRGRAFFVYAGDIWARVSRHFGQESEMRVHTPASIAAVRGTTFSVHHNRADGQSHVACGQGFVSARGLYGRSQFVTANRQARIDADREIEDPRQMPENMRATYRHGALWREIVPPHWLAEAEQVVVQTLDAPLTILGIGKASWAIGAADYARVAACQEALRRIHQHVEGAPHYPHHIHPATLEQLPIPDDRRRQVLESFHCNAIELYQQLQGGRSFVLFARARDREKTLFKLTPYGVEEATERELQYYRQTA